LKAICDTGTVIALALAFLFGLGAWFSGNIVNDRQAAQLRKFDKDLTTAKTGLVDSQRATAEVANQLEQERQKTARLRMEAAAAVENLNQRFVQANRPRRITMGARGDGKTDDRQERQKRFKALDEFAGTVAIIQPVSGEEPKTLASDIWVALHQHGWNPVILDESQTHISSLLIRPGVRIATLEKAWGFKPNKGDRPPEFAKPDWSPSRRAAIALFSLLSLDLGPPYETAPFSLSYEPEYKNWGPESPYPGEDVTNPPAMLITASSSQRERW
jgi:hypothetical protein